MGNIKPVLKVEQGKPIIKFISLRQIAKDEELAYDYSDWTQVLKTFPMANEIKNKGREKIKFKFKIINEVIVNKIVYN